MEKKKKFIVDVTFYSLIFLLLWTFLKFVFPVLIPFVIAFIIASILRIPARKLYKIFIKANRFISISICVVFYVLIFFLLAVAGINIYNGVADFVISVPELYQNNIVPALNKVSEIVTDTLKSSDISFAEEIQKVFNDFVNNLGNYIKEFSVNAIKLISGGIISIPGFIIKLVVMIISTFFFMVDYDKIMSFFTSCIPKSKEDTVINTVVYFKNTIFIYLKSYTLLFLLTYVELAIGFSILGIPYAPLIGLLVAIFDILPILGTGGILLPWAVILFVMRNISMGIGMLILYLVITFIRNTAEPKLVGKQIGLHPLATLIFMYLGLKFLGFIGMFLFPVTLAVVMNMRHSKEREQQAQ